MMYESHLRKHAAPKRGELLTEALFVVCWAASVPGLLWLGRLAGL